MLLSPVAVKLCCDPKGSPEAATELAQACGAAGFPPAAIDRSGGPVSVERVCSAKVAALEGSVATRLVELDPRLLAAT